ncbi:hypothetical protein GH733_010970 [Mirounga leonina]|nr:hypothetical protein GH733_010970 [Mirounga leonina]
MRKEDEDDEETPPTILTFHDVGLNHKLCSNAFFNFEGMQEIAKHFVVCHVDAPGGAGEQHGAGSELLAADWNIVSHANPQLFWNMYNSCRDLDINLPGAVPNIKTFCLVILVVEDKVPAKDGRDIEDTISINIKSDFNLRNATRGKRYVCEFELANYDDKKTLLTQSATTNLLNFK